MIFCDVSDILRRVNKNRICSVDVRGQPFVECNDRVLEYMKEIMRGRVFKDEMHGQKQIEVLLL